MGRRNRIMVHVWVTEVPRMSCSSEELHQHSAQECSGNDSSEGQFQDPQAGQAVGPGRKVLPMRLREIQLQCPAWGP